MTAQRELLLLAPDLGYWTPLIGSSSLEGLTMLGSGTVARTGFGLLDIAPENAILVSLVILGLGSGSRLGCGSLGDPVHQ